MNATISNDELSVTISWKKDGINDQSMPQCTIHVQYR